MVKQIFFNIFPNCSGNFGEGIEDVFNVNYESYDDDRRIHVMNSETSMFCSEIQSNRGIDSPEYLTNQHFLVSYYKTTNSNCRFIKVSVDTEIDLMLPFVQYHNLFYSRMIF